MNSEKDISGGVLIDKPRDWTSHDVVQKIRSKLKTKKVGHTGTLDPMATGLLVVLVGSSVRLSDYLLNQDKSYSVICELGFETDTWDITGIEQHRNTEITLNERTIREAVYTLEGRFEWPVPLYSAKKVNGQVLYNIARKNKDLENYEGPKASMNFWGLENICVNGNRVSFDVSCSKGSYIRSWVYQLGRALGVGATMTSLRRTRVGSLSIDDAVSLESEFISKQTLLSEIKSFRSIQSLLENQAIVPISEVEFLRLKNGLVSHSFQERLRNIIVEDVIYPEFKGRVVGILRGPWPFKVARLLDT